MERNRDVGGLESHQQVHAVVVGSETEELRTESPSRQPILLSPKPDDPVTASMVAVEWARARIVEDDVLGEETRRSLAVAASPSLDHAPKQRLVGVHHSPPNAGPNHTSVSNRCDQRDRRS